MFFFLCVRLRNEHSKQETWQGYTKVNKTFLLNAKEQIRNFDYSGNFFIDESASIREKLSSTFCWESRWNLIPILPERMEFFMNNLGQKNVPHTKEYIFTFCICAPLVYFLNQEMTKKGALLRCIFCIFWHIFWVFQSLYGNGKLSKARKNPHFQTFFVAWKSPGKNLTKEKDFLW